jgi:uncharacterized protein YjdB
MKHVYPSLLLALMLSIAGNALMAHAPKKTTANIPVVNTGKQAIAIPSTINLPALPTSKLPGKQNMNAGKQLSFIENKGQITDQHHRPRHDIQYSLTAGKGLTIFVGNGAIHYQWATALQHAPKDLELLPTKPIPNPKLQIPDSSETVSYSMYRMDVALIGANKHATIITEEKQEYYENYFTPSGGKDGATAHAYNRIVYKNVYPHIDWVLYTNAEELKHEFVVHVGGRVNDIKLKYGGITTLKLDNTGALIAATPQGNITELAPYSYQKDGKKITSSFKLNGNVLSYETGAYEGDLVIDPTIAWATYYGGTISEYGYSVAVDGDGNAWMAGRTNSTTDIATSGAHDITFGGSTDAFLVKFNSAGVRQWATYYGGTGFDEGRSVAVDGDGNTWMTGFTNSTTDIATTGSHDVTHGGLYDAFLVKFNSAGGLQWATYYGGTSSDYGMSVAIDGSGKAWIAGYTQSTTAIATTGAHDETLGDRDAFLVKFNSAGVRQWATYYGSASSDEGYSVAVDGDGNAWMAGITKSTADIASTGAHDETYGGTQDAFLVKFNSAGVRQWATYYGGINDEFCYSVAVDGDGNAWIAGYTHSTTDIATIGAHDETLGVRDAFLVKFNSAGVRQWATYYGGTNADAGLSVSVDGDGNAWMAGQTLSTTDIATTGAHDETFGGFTNDAYLVKFNSAGVRQWATYFGGTGDDLSYSVAVDGDGNAWLAGYARSATDIATSGAHDVSIGGSYDAFLAKFTSTDCSLPTITTVSPSIAAPSASVTITGTNFNTSTGNNIVYFGATRATVTTASATSLTVTVPTGATYMPVTVNNTATALTAFSRYPFLPTYDNSGYISGAVNFDPKVDFATGLQPFNAQIGDIDGDGKPDVVVANSSSNTISVYRNTSSISGISFATPVTFPTPSGPGFVAIGDIDGDGKPDLTVSCGFLAVILVYRNTSISGIITTGSFASPVAFGSIIGPCRSIAIGDIDGDGRPELAVAHNNSISGVVSVYRNISSVGSINFTSYVTFAAGVSPYSVAIGDVDGDSKPDMVAVNGGDDRAVSVFRNISTSGSITSASFAARVTFATGNLPLRVAIGDIDGDSKPELITANNSSNSISVYHNTSSAGSITSGSFAAQVTFETESNPHDVAIGDIDGDGKPDLAVANTGANKVSILRNTTSIGSINSSSFSTQIRFTTGEDPFSIAIGDIDGDGKPDIVTPNVNDNSFSVFRNNALVAPPAITTVSPNPANPGTSVTITGTSFNTTPANNIVYFGATKATVTAAGGTSLTATVPTGATYMPVSVNNTATSLAGYSQYPFLPKYDNSAYTNTVLNFSAGVNFTTGPGPLRPIMGDVDGDGKPDMIVANSGANTVSVFRNISSSGTISTSAFSAKVDFATGNSPRSIAFGDMDGDGKPDIMVANGASNTISVLRNTATSGAITSGSLATKVDFATSGSPENVSVGDLDGDGKLEMVTVSLTTGQMSVFRNTAASGAITGSSFAAPVNFTAGTNSRSAIVMDFDGDGKKDVAIVTPAFNIVSVYRNTSTPGIISSASFATKVDFATGSNPLYVLSGDIDGDGKPDLIVANQVSNTISVLRNTATVGGISSGSFATKVDFTSAVGPYDMAAGDFNGDGKLDIAVSCESGSDVISVFRNTATSGAITSGSFASKIDLTTGVDPSVGVGDVDGDGKADIIATNYGSNNVSVFRNNPLTAPPSITTVSPNPANPGTTVTITGSGFNTISTNNVVYFGATKANVTTASTTTLTATVPVGATYMPVTVNNTSSSLTGYSQYPFLPTWDNTAYVNGIINFSPRQDFAGNTGTIVDIDGDGKSDLVGINNAFNTVLVYRNIGTSGTLTSGSFASAVSFATGSGPRRVSVADIDGDGRPDVVITNNTGNTVSVLRNISTSGSVSFAAKVDFVTVSLPSGSAVRDVDGDGRPDIVACTGDASGTTLCVLRNTTEGGVISFAPKVDFTTGQLPYNVEIQDIDGDGRPELITTNFMSNTISVLRNTSVPGSITSGSFAAKVDFSTGGASNPISLTVGDIDGDSKPDVAASGASSNMISVFRNTSTVGAISSGSFATKVDFSVGGQAQDVKMGDFDGDSKPDIVGVNIAIGMVYVFRNTATSGAISTGSFASPITLNGGGAGGVAVGDLDGDSKPDLAVANTAGTGFFRNSPIFLPPTITSVSPNPANPGTSVTIAGSNFNTTPANNIVYFGATRATVTAAGSTSLTATVPVGATYMPVSVNNTAAALTGYGQYPFLPTYDNSGYVGGLVNFEPKVDFEGHQPYSISTGDIDGDGKTDIVVMSRVLAQIRVYRNTSTSGVVNSSSFAAYVPFDCASTGSGIFADISLGDIDGDGKLDIVLCGENSIGFHYVAVLRNLSSVGVINGSSFAPAVYFGVGSYSRKICLGDLDNDGKMDVAVTCFYNKVSVLRNISDIGLIAFESRIDFTTGSEPKGIAIGDIDNDGWKELVVTNDGSTSNSISVFRNTTVGILSAISFASSVNFSTENSPSDVQIGDLNGDNKLDLIVANESSHSVSIFKNTSTVGFINSSTFAARVDLDPGSDGQPSSVAVGDIDGDNLPDLVIGKSGPRSFSVLRNIGTSVSIDTNSFSGYLDFGVSTDSYRDVVVSDIDGDSKPDILTNNFNNGTFSVFHNSPLSPTVGAATVCVGSTTNLTNPTTGGTWNSSNTSIATVGSTGVVTGVAAGTAAISYTVAGGSATTIVTVNALPTAGTITGTPSVCQGNTATLSTAATGGVWSSGAATIATVDSAGAVSGVSAGTATISYTVTNGCGAVAATQVVTVNPNPYAGTISGTATVNAGATISLSNGITGGTWSSSNTSIATVGSTGVVTGVAPGTATISYSVTNSCGTVSATEMVTVLPAAPTVTSVSPNPANPGTSITITGTNFNTTPANNIVFFGATRATVTAAGTTSLTATVPVGATFMPVSVNNTAAALTGYGQYPFLPTYDNSLYISGVVNFSNNVPFTTGSNPTSVAIGDIDGDGKSDMAVTNTSSNTVSIYRNASSSGSITSGSFATPVTFTTGTHPFGVAIGDIDGDGKPDLAVANLSSDYVSVFRNTSTSGSITSGSFAPQVTFLTAGSGTRSVAIGDIDGDGKPDLVAAKGSANSISVLRNTGTIGSISSGSFAAEVSFATGTLPYRLALGDINGDGKPDVVVPNYSSNTVSIFRNTSSIGAITSGSFATEVTFATGNSPSSVAIGDLDGDGKVDLAVSNKDDHTVSVFRNTSSGDSITSGSLAPQITFAIGSTPFSVAIGDIDGDSKPDLAVANSFYLNVSVLRNTSSVGSITSGSFATQVLFATGSNSHSVAIGDIDGDGKPELAVANAGSNNVTVLRNSPLQHIEGTTTFCAATTTTLTNPTTGGTWSSSNISVATVDSTGAVTGVAAGTATISYTVTGGSAITIVTVNALPTAGTIAGTASVCQGNTTTLSTATTGGVWSSGAATIATVDSAGAVSGVSAGTATISYTLTNGCGSVAATSVVTVNALPAAFTVTGGGNYCFGGSGVNIGLSGSQIGVSYQLYYGSAPLGSPITGTGSAISFGLSTGAGTYSVQATNIATSCSSAMTGNATISINPLPSVYNVVGGGGYCAGGAGSNVGLSNSQTGVNYQLYYDGTAIGSPFAGTGSTVSFGTYTAAGTYSVLATNATTTCSVAMAGTAFINIVALPSGGTITGTSTVNIGAIVTLSNATTGGVWSSSNTSVATVGSTGIVTGVAAGTATISYTVTNSCGAASATKVVTVNAPALETEITGTLTVCVGAATMLSNATPDGTWSSSTTAVALVDEETGVVTGIAAGAATISYTLSGVSMTAVVTVNAFPGSISGTLSVCVGNTTSLSSSPSGGTWTSGNISRAIVDAGSGLVTGVSTGNVDITYTLAGGCRRKVTVTVAATPAAITGALSLCSGSTTALSSATTGGSWSSAATGVATVDAGTGVVTGISTGTATISYSNGSCAATVIATVNAAAGANTGAASVCIGSSSSLSNTTIGGTWSSSDAAIATVHASTGLVTGISTGVVNITYTATPGCYAVTSFTVNATVTAITGTMTVCPGATTTLSSATSGGSWSSSNTTRATVDAGTGVVTGVSGGTVTISYVVSAGCSQTAVVTVNTSPAGISGTATVCEGATTTLTCSPGGGTWSSSSAAATVGSTGIVTGVSAGTATITYTVATGCAATREVTVNATPTAITGSLGVCVGSTSSLSSTPSGGTWAVTFISKATVGSTTGIITGVAVGTTPVTYTVGGCRTTATVSVVTSPAAIGGTLTLCAGSTTNLTSATTGGTWTSNNTAIASVVSGTGVVTGVGTGTAIISYSNGTCETTAVVTVNAALGANTGSSTVCVGQGTDLNNATSGGTWSTSNTAIATVNTTTGLVAGVSAGTVNISYRIGAGCFTITEMTVNATLSSITGTATVCPGATTALSHSDAGGVWTSGIPARATIDAGSGVVTGVSAGTVYITYAVGGCFTTRIVTVSAAPGAVGGTASMCVGATTALTCSPIGGTWSSSDIATATVSGTGVVTGLITGNATISYTRLGCAAIRVVTVTAAPGAIGGTLSACIGTNTTLTSSPGGGTWSSSNAARATVGVATGVVTGVSAGTVIITYALSATCRTTAVVTINSSAGTISGSLTVCETCTGALSSATTGGVWSSSNTAAATIGAATGIVSGVGIGTTTISYVAGGCSSSAVVTVIAAIPSSFGTPVVCVGQTNATMGNPVAGGTWSSSNTSMATIHAATGLLTGIAVGNPYITYTTSPGIYTITVATVSAAVANITGTTAICPGATLALSNATTGGAWSSTNTAIASVVAGTGVVTGVTAGTTTISYFINVGCYKAIIQMVNTVPGLTGASTVINGASTTFGGSPGGGTWSSANTAIASVSGTGVVTGNGVAATTITYTLGTGCFRTKAITVLTSKPGETEGATLENAGVLKVYPNPTSGQLTIEAPQNGTFSIFTIDGKQVAQYTVTTTAATVSLPKELAAGIYMCRFTGADGSTAIVRLVFEP